MADVLIVVPYQAGCEHRSAALLHVGQHLTEHHGGYALAELPAGDWCKAAAIAPAVAASDASVLVLHDADVITAPEALNAAIDAVTTGRSRWAIPHTTVYRLDAGSTAAVLAGAALDSRRWRLDRMAYRGVEAGGVVVVDRALYEEAPLDRRFLSWGGEDLSASIAWRCLAGPPWRGNARLHHLFHEPQDRISPAVGSRASKLLHIRYSKAAGDRDAMRALIAEGRATVSAVNDPAEAR